MIDYVVSAEIDYHGRQVRGHSIMTEQTIFPIRDVNARVRAIVERETIGKPFWMEGSVRRHYSRMIQRRQRINIPGTMVNDAAALTNIVMDTRNPTLARPLNDEARNTVNPRPTASAL